jgi:hypothetical protein
MITTLTKAQHEKLDVIERSRPSATVVGYERFSGFMQPHINLGNGLVERLTRSGKLVKI